LYTEVQPIGVFLRFFKVFLKPVKKDYFAITDRISFAAVINSIVVHTIES